MGITGLLPFVKKASTKCHVRKFSGCTVAIDAYCWLHKGAFGCADKLGKGEPTTAYITYCFKYLNVLLSHNIKPILVLDGRNLGSKAHTEKQRRERRDDNKKKAKEYLRKGMKKEAWECFTRCIDITPAMAREFIKTLREKKIDYIVAPYEADAQLAYLARQNIVDIVITEDSDLILFGCPKIFFKMSVTGDGVLFDQSKIHSCMGMKVEHFQFERFRWMSMLSGCDYLPSLPGIGLARAKKVFTLATSGDIRKILEQIPKLLGLDVEVTEEYIEGFIRSENTFLYQLVFDPINRRLIPLTPYPANFDLKNTNLDYAGKYEDKKLALDMALGNVDIHTLKKVDDFDPMRSKTGYNETSMWSPRFKIPSVTKLITARDMKNGTKHSTTIGMKANISVGSSLKKRPLLDPDFVDANPVDDNTLLSMYSVKDEFTDDKDVDKLNEQTKKRMRLEDTPEKEDDHSKSSKKKTPFLKSRESSFEISKTPDKTNIAANSANKNPLCVIERNKIYEEGNVVVKSQYFRKIEPVDPENMGKKTLHNKNGPQTQKSNFEIGLYASEEEDSDEAELKLVVNLENSEETSQMSIYSLRSEDLSELSGDHEDSQKLSDSDLSQEGYKSPVYKVDTDTVAEDYSPPNQIKSRLRNSPVARKPSSDLKSKGLLGRCRTIGLSKNALKHKVDPKQKTIASMFAMQQKPKL